MITGTTRVVPSSSSKLCGHRRALCHACASAAIAGSLDAGVERGEDRRAGVGAATALRNSRKSSRPGAVVAGVRRRQRPAARRGRRRARRSVPARVSMRIRSPSWMRASGPPSAASGVQWIAAGTLPEAPDMRPSVTSATAVAAALQHAERRASGGAAPASRWPWGPGSARPRRRRRRTRPRAKASRNSCWSSNTRAGASMIRGSSPTADTLITPRPSEPSSTRMPPSSANGWSGERSTVGSTVPAAGAVAPDRARRRPARARAVAAQPAAGDRQSRPRAADRRRAAP